MRTIIGWSLLILLPGTLFAWGPHPQITRAAQSVLPEAEKAAAYFGKDWSRMQEYCLMPDLRGSVREDYYPNDFLLWPASPVHVGHMVPEVRTTYAPFFRRALQALRTESPQNAARWMGSLVHFVEDSGAPCHARPIKGEMHKRLENWLDGNAVGIEAYQPQLLGADDEAALAGLQRRMEELIAFSAARADQIFAQVEALKERQDQPVILECANQSARVCADVLHTLLVLGWNASPAVTLSGSVSWPAAGPLPKHPAKVVLMGTPYSTLTDSAGGWQFRNLPANRYAAGVERPGNRTIVGEETTVALQASEPAGNLVRNPDFRLGWNQPGVPDHWKLITVPKSPQGWESDPLRVYANGGYRVGVDAKRALTLRLRWRTAAGEACGANDFPCAAGRNEFEVTAPATAGAVELILLSEGRPSELAAGVWLTTSEKP